MVDSVILTIDKVCPSTEFSFVDGDFTAKKLDTTIYFNRTEDLKIVLYQNNSEPFDAFYMRGCDTPIKSESLGKKHMLYIPVEEDSVTIYAMSDTCMTDSVVLSIKKICPKTEFTFVEGDFTAKKSETKICFDRSEDVEVVIYQNNDFADTSSVVVDGFTIQNGSAANGGGVNITANTTINNCIIKANSASNYGSAIYATGAVVKNCQIFGNTNSDRVYYTVRLNNCVMDSCVVKDNKTYYNAAILAENKTKVTNSVLEGNNSVYLYYSGSSFNNSELSNCKFVNTSGPGACVYLQSSVMKNCLFDGNTNVNEYLVRLDGNSKAEE